MDADASSKGTSETDRIQIGVVSTGLDSKRL